jgi:peptidoglycan/xylan/chitin deacetylase (PgdA/CDA1 family)
MEMKTMRKRFALTVDVEPDRPPLPEENQKPFTYKGIDDGMPILFDLLEQFRCRATFFALGETAQKFPSLVPEVSRRGHEVACHTFHHRDCSKVEAAALAEDIDRATTLLRTQTRDPIVGFRFPYFRLNPSVMPTLRELGFKYDISLLEFSNGHQEYIQAALAAGLRLFWNSRVFESERHMHVRFGGWMLRQKTADELLAITRALLAERDVVNFYIHPWEFISLPSKINVEDHFDPADVIKNFVAMLEECGRQQVEFVGVMDLLGARPAPGERPS